MTERLVDYGAAAGRYDAGRALADETLERWRAVVGERVPAGSDVTVLDVGAGTGLFAEAWCAWGAGTVVAVEPEGAMREQARLRPGRRFAVVGGTAERIPIAGGAADVVWMSAVLHHLTEPPVAAQEISRVLAPGGHALVRGYFPDVGSVPWLDEFPGAERARARFPTTTAAAALFAGAGLDLVDVVTVREPRTATRGMAADWVELMRAADSLLTALTDDEIAVGVGRLRDDPDAELSGLVLGLLTFEKSTGQ